MASTEFNVLKVSVSELERDLLNFAVRITEPYTSEELLKCQAYVVFSHAEIQVYWEKAARRILSEAEKRWRTSKVIDRVIGSLIAFRRTDSYSIPENPAQPVASADISKMIDHAMVRQKEAIEKNNGIKSSNLANLLCPLGMMKENFSTTFLIQSDQTGKKRGEFVHKSSSVSVRTIRDPFADEKGDIDNLINEIQLMDSQLELLGLLSISTISTPTGTPTTVTP